MVFLREVDVYHISPCFADNSKIRLKATLSDDIASVMPYLNSVVKNAIYNQHVPNLTLHKDFRMITLQSRELIMIKALNSTDAYQIIDWLKELINDTYEKKDEIEPIYIQKRRPHPLQLYGWLPKTNCRRCGEKTCLAFAAMVFAGFKSLKLCEMIFMEEYLEHLEVLLELTAALGYDDIVNN